MGSCLLPYVLGIGILRQMRNRDSAMKSRERKKIYVKDLEMKSRYLESECRRLRYAFQCCVAENLALRQCLQNGRAFGAPAARQESAVLLMGKKHAYLKHHLYLHSTFFYFAVCDFLKLLSYLNNLYLIIC